MQTTNACLRFAVASAFLMLWAPASADHLSWHQQSPSYDVHLGVVPPTILQQDVALHRMHPGVDRQRGSSRHLLVAVFKRPGGERVQNAEVTAEVIENDLVHVRKAQKPLHRMTVSNTVTYCNFFDLHWDGRYKVRVNIREPGERPEEVTFIQEIRGLRS